MAGSSSDGYFPVSYASFSTPTSRPYYDGAASDTSSAGSTGPTFVATTSAGEDYLIDDGSTYYASNDPGYGGYYGDVVPAGQGPWVTGHGGDVQNFATTAAGAGNYFYAGEDVRTTRA